MQSLTKRLSAVASLVNPGCKVVDIGTDHGYVPVFLVKNNIVSSAIAADINEGPLNSCKSYIEKEGLSLKIKTVLSNGFESIDDDFDTAVIAGMGGELICNILSKYENLNRLHLILNPMTHCELVRKFLYDNGFEINNDLIIDEGKHHYNVMDAVYTGVVTPKTESDYYLGNIKDFSDKEYFYHLLNYLRNKEKSGQSMTDIITAVEEKL